MSMPSDADNSQTKIIVGNLNPSLDEEQIVDIFKSIGKINHISLLNGKCSIQFDNEESAVDAVMAFDSQTLNGFIINVKLDTNSEKNTKRPATSLSNSNSFDTGNIS